jgi:hypothetical protein
MIKILYQEIELGHFYGLNGKPPEERVFNS